MGLDDVANSPGRVVEGATAVDAEVFRHRDLHALDVCPIPEGFDDRIGEAKEQHVVDRALPQVVVDPEDVALDERAEQDLVQFARRRQIVAEGFLDDDARSFRTAGLRQLRDDGSEEWRRYRQIVRGVLRGAEGLPERRESRRIVVVAIDVAQQPHELVERRAVESAVRLDAIPRSRAQLVRVQPALATPITGTSRSPRLAIA